MYLRDFTRLTGWGDVKTNRAVGYGWLRPTRREGATGSGTKYDYSVRDAFVARVMDVIGDKIHSSHVKRMAADVLHEKEGDWLVLLIDTKIVTHYESERRFRSGEKSVVGAGAREIVGRSAAALFQSPEQIVELMRHARSMVTVINVKPYREEVESATKGLTHAGHTHP